MLRIKHLLEYAALRSTQTLMVVLPHRLALLTGWMLAWVVFHLLRIGRAEAIRRINTVFAEAMTPTRARHIAWISWRNTAFNVVEMMRVTRLSAAWMAAHTTGTEKAIAQLKSLTENHGGAIIAVAHMGNWDLAGVACRQSGVDIFSIAGKQKNPYVNRWLNQTRGHSMEVLERGSSALRVVLRRLQRGGVFAILPDVRIPVKDLDIAFLGGRANLGRGMAQFARTANVPILPVTLVRHGWSRHEALCHPPIFPDRNLEREADLIRMTQIVADHVTAAIMAHPEQWFWYNRRWVLMPLKPPKKKRLPATGTEGG